MVIRERMAVKEEVIYIQKQAEVNQGKKGQSVVSARTKRQKLYLNPCVRTVQIS